MTLEEARKAARLPASTASRLMRRACGHPVTGTFARLTGAPSYTDRCRARLTGAGRPNNKVGGRALRAHPGGAALILITGATGTVGREVVKRLSARGVPVRACTPTRRTAPEAVSDFSEFSSTLSQTAPPSTSLLPKRSLAPVLAEERSCGVPW